MGARWQKNEVTAAKRRCDLIVQKSDGTLAPRETDFITLGYVFFGGANTPDLDLALGTLTNKRRALVVADDTFTAAATDICTAVAHGLQTGDGPIRLTTTGTLPAGLALATDYYVIKIDADTFKLATSLANAYAGTAVDITDAGTGTHTLSDTASTQRGLDGHFTYQATQAETNHDNPESIIIIDGTNYERSSGWGAYTTVEMGSDTAFWDEIGEGAHSYGDLVRGVARTLLAKFSKTGNDYVYRDLADSKNSHTGTVTASGKTAAGITDLT